MDTGKAKSNEFTKFFADMTDIHEILPSNDLMKLVKTYGCEKSMTQIKICEFLQFIKFGFSSEQLQPVSIDPRAKMSLIRLIILSTHYFRIYWP